MGIVWLDDAVNIAFNTVWWVGSHCQVVAVKIRLLLKQFCDNQIVSDGESEVEKVDGS